MLMEKLNNASSGIVSKIIFGLIGVSFVLSGVAGYMFIRTDTSVAKVNGEEISQQVFLQQYNNEYQRLSENLGAKFAEVADSAAKHLRHEVLDRLINQELLRQYAQELKLGISDKQVSLAIVNSPMFQNEGKFDNKIYQQILASSGISSDTYAAYVREGLVLEQLQQGIANSDFQVPIQLNELAKNFFQRRDVRLAVLSLDDEMQKQTVTEQEIEQYYQANKANFAVPERVKVQYLDLTRAIADQKVKISDIEIAQYYQDNKAQYITKHLAHIQLPTEQEAQSVYANLQNGEDFAALAKLYSMDTLSAPKGGDLDWVVNGMMPLAFESAVTLLNVGEYSQPVKVDNAYHIIKVLDMKTRELNDVKEEIATKLRNDLVTNAFYSLEKQMNEKAFENPQSLEEAAKVAGLDIKETDYFSRQDLPPELNYSHIATAIFNSDLMQGGINSEAINVGDQHSVLLRVVDYKPEGIRTLAEATADIETYLKRQKAETTLFNMAEKIVAEMNTITDFKLPSYIHFSEKETWVYRDADNKDPVLGKVIFSMKKPDPGKTTISVAKNMFGDIVFVELMNVEDSQLTPEQKQLFGVQIAEIKQFSLSNLLIQALREKASIEINTKFINEE
ncbi:peptidylprolyl isomerase [Histophilus somni]|uniref:peptidylprolyl isomerase n=1 Tax=Histophilus somni TaxID=731 RepID=UPI00201F5E6F|nr:peptidylprolyl isomerase [Histophilus somni]